ncbi:hypothetical protein GCM10028805_46040 [Spirosoma harenae]
MKPFPAFLQSQQRIHNDVVSMLALLYSPEGIEAFTEMASGNFSIDWEQLTHDQAHWILYLLGVAESYTVLEHKPDIFSLMPPIIDKALHVVATKLGVYRPILEGIEAGRLSSFEAKVLGGDMDIRQGKGVTVSVDDLLTQLENAA